MRLKHLIPKCLRLRFQMLKRSLQDWKSGTKRLFADSSYEQKVIKEFPFLKELIQPLGNSNFVQSKMHNLKIASTKINQVIIQPGQIFSFWKIIGQPSARNGYQKGRNLVNGKLVADYGGGLCQLSGAIYFFALKNDIEIIERHNHSTDIYKESERYTPLGADATVVFGYKDLRLKNCFDFELKFEIVIPKNQLICRLKSEKQLIEKTIAFERNYSSKTVKVTTLIEGKQSEVSSYKILANPSED